MPVSIDEAFYRFNRGFKDPPARDRNIGRGECLNRCFLRIIAAPFSTAGRVAQLAKHTFKFIGYSFLTLFTVGTTREFKFLNFFSLNPCSEQRRNAKKEGICTAICLAHVVKIPFDLLAKTLLPFLGLVSPNTAYKIISFGHRIDYKLDKRMKETKYPHIQEFNLLKFYKETQPGFSYRNDIKRKEIPKEIEVKEIKPLSHKKYCKERAKCASEKRRDCLGERRRSESDFSKLRKGGFLLISFPFEQGQRDSES